MVLPLRVNLARSGRDGQGGSQRKIWDERKLVPPIFISNRSKDRIVTPKFIVTGKEPWIHFVDLFLVFFSLLLGHAQKGIIEEISYALLNDGRLPVENPEIQVDTVHLGKSQIAAVYDLTICSGVPIEFLEFERQAEKAGKGLFVFLINAFQFGL